MEPRPLIPFVRSPRILPILNMSQRYRKAPSEILRVEDSYAAYCLDEACAYIMQKVADGEEIVFKKHYSRPSELYAEYERG